MTEDINTANIRTPIVLQVLTSTPAAKAGKNILCERPFCMTLEEGDEACEGAEKAGVTLMVGESYVYMQSIIEGRLLVDAGEAAELREPASALGSGLSGLAYGSRPGRRRRFSLGVWSTRAFLCHMAGALLDRRVII